MSKLANNQLDAKLLVLFPSFLSSASEFKQRRIILVHIWGVLHINEIQFEYQNMLIHHLAEYQSVN